MERALIMVAAAALALASVAQAKEVPQAKGRPKSDPNWCWGTFARHSCMNGTSGADCAYPREAGDKDEFMGWSIEDGQRVYVIYRMGAYPAANIALSDGCRLREWK